MKSRTLLNLGWEAASAEKLKPMGRWRQQRELIVLVAASLRLPRRSERRRVEAFGADSNPHGNTAP
jgi:hypothetical protein